MIPLLSTPRLMKSSFSIATLSFALLSAVQPAFADELSDLKSQVETLSQRLSVVEKELAVVKDSKSEMSGKPPLQEAVSLDCAHPELGTAALNKIDVSYSKALASIFRDDIPKMLTAARVVPYFRNGRTTGLRLFAIREESLYQQAGLKNGDILIAVDGHGTCDPDSIYSLPFFKNPVPEESTILIERSRQPVELHVKAK